MVGEKQSLATKKTALQAMAERLQVDEKQLTAILKKTVCAPFKLASGGTREITDEEFMSIIIIANAYQLNPIIKEIYFYPDVKSGKIVPVVGTDGWNSMIQRHEKYKTHFYRQSDKMVTMPKAKPCPEWMEVVFVKQDGSEVVIREYLDECFRDLDYKSPWQTHTKRQLRHKTKIQGAREGLGFVGIYDKDEAERIFETIDAETTPALEPARPMPQALTPPAGQAPAPAPASAPATPPAKAQEKAPESAQEAGNPAEAMNAQDPAPQASQAPAGPAGEAPADLTKGGLPITDIAVLAQVKEAGIYPATRGVYRDTFDRKVKSKTGVVYDHIIEDPDVPEAKITISTWGKLPDGIKKGDTVDAITVKVVTLASGRVCYGADLLEFYAPAFGE